MNDRITRLVTEAIAIAPVFHKMSKRPAKFRLSWNADCYFGNPVVSITRFACNTCLRSCATTIL